MRKKNVYSQNVYVYYNMLVARTVDIKLYLRHLLGELHEIMKLRVQRENIFFFILIFADSSRHGRVGTFQ